MLLSGAVTGAGGVAERRGNRRGGAAPAAPPGRPRPPRPRCPWSPAPPGSCAPRRCPAFGQPPPPTCSAAAPPCGRRAEDEPRSPPAAGPAPPRLSLCSQRQNRTLNAGGALSCVGFGCKVSPQIHTDIDVSSPLSHHGLCLRAERGLPATTAGSHVQGGPHRLGAPSLRDGPWTPKSLSLVCLLWFLKYIYLY